MRPSPPARIIARAIAGMVLGAISFARAEDASRAPRPSISETAARDRAGQAPECTCRAGGASHQLGTQICLGRQLVRCAMDLNVTSWQAVGTECPES